uniref:Gag-Pol polyprotein n=1 Tax=Tanacetum cinerariifolium TaxID=118510 RepID=A0A6L2L001_TANCI|nr:hypothetical protein [Tanacetum cinerariifolium]
MKAAGQGMNAMKSTFGDDADIRPFYDMKPMVEVPYTAEYNVFAVETQHSEQSECIINTCVVEKIDSNVIPDSPDMCDNDIQTDQNVEDERAALANLIANLKRDIDENKTIQKQLKKANASLTQELKECKSTLLETSRTLGESNSIRDSCLVALQSKQTEFERYKAFNDRTVDYDKLKLTLHSWPQVRKSSSTKPYDVNAPGPFRNRPKHVSFQSPRESVGSNDMVNNYYLEEAKKKAQLQKDKALNTKTSVQQSARLPNTANGNKLKPRNFNQQPKNWPPSMSSRVSNTTINIAEPPINQKPFLESKYLACPTCKQCIFSANHDECIIKYISELNSRASAQKKDTQSHKTTKRYMPVEKK